ncbi:hypothetical protein RIF25_04980 [Thermosynechococcaceae cyanobacterium BACA0444]|uniref:Uncharacterized protein n=1 Tax=Pseudocalidococcus azoricus BACA0444 TaxID=2918990 RepID=A0AAE4FR57_9CYAN|nr:hypothetical protein [Pseudocalidococcus azoricus]MDS3860154.1 hypothetical protein [Pseudocalidococcus azoricus BACA0444]
MDSKELISSLETALAEIEDNLRSIQLISDECIEGFTEPKPEMMMQIHILAEQALKQVKTIKS